MKGIVMFAVLFFSVIFFITPGAFALDQATVTGSLTVNGKAIQMSTGYAHLHDNSEKVLDHPKELRILLTDRDVAESTLRGLVFLEVEEMAKEGKVQGMLFEMDPADPNNFVLTYLYPPPPGAFLVRKTISTSGKAAFKKFEISNGRIMGEIDDMDSSSGSDSDLPKFDVSVKFNVPVFNEPAVTSDLKGKAALKSPQAVLLGRKANAMSKGDMKALKKLSSAKANKRIEAFAAQPEVVAYMKQAGVEMEKTVNKISRVVVRGDRAVAIFEGGKEWASFVKEDGEWKSDN